MSKALYPGSFDPVTMGHVDIIRRSARIFDEVVVSVVDNPAKAPLFTPEERVDMLKDVCSGLPNVTVGRFGGLLVNYASQIGAQVIVKGLRALSDFESELQQAHFNRQLRPEVETIFLATEACHSFLSSSLVKEVSRLGGQIAGLVPEGVERRLAARMAENR